MQAFAAHLDEMVESSRRFYTIDRAESVREFIKMPKPYRQVFCHQTRIYRYRLDVTTECRGQRSLALVQLNPSVANSDRSDPTLGKVARWANENGFARLVLMNLFAFRTAHQSDLIGQPYRRVVGPQNNKAIEDSIANSQTIILGWGEPTRAILPLLNRRITDIRQLCGRRRIHVVGALVKGRYPRHGLLWNEPDRDVRPCEWAKLIAED